MPDPVWYRSLYWRIAFGFVAMLAALLLAQGLVFVWLTDRVVGWSAQSPQELVSSVASDLASAFTRNPGSRSTSYVRDQFSHIYRPFVVVMIDGRAASNRPNGLPPGYLRAVQQRLRRGESLNAVDPRDGGRGGRGGRDRGFDRRREPGSFDPARDRPDASPADTGREARRATEFRPGDGPGEPPRGSASAPIVSRQRPARPLRRSDSSSSRSTRRRCSWPSASSGRR